MTNADRIRQMTDEKLAVWFAPHMKCSMCDRDEERGCDRNDCIQSALAWLKKEADEDAGNQAD